MLSVYLCPAPVFHCIPGYYPNWWPKVWRQTVLSFANYSRNRVHQPENHWSCCSCQKQEWFAAYKFRYTTSNKFLFMSHVMLPCFDNSDSARLPTSSWILAYMHSRFRVNAESLYVSGSSSAHAFIFRIFRNISLGVSAIFFSFLSEPFRNQYLWKFKILELIRTAGSDSSDHLSAISAL